MDDLRRALAERYPRVALTHEWLTIPGGSEKVVAAIVELLPHAEIHTTICDPAVGWSERLGGVTIHTSSLDRLPGARTNYPRLLPLMDRAFRSFDLSGVDLVVSSNHANAKNIRTPEGTAHVCYCYTPMRYAWDPAFLEGERMGTLSKAAFRAYLPRLRRTDLRGARQPQRWAACSTEVAGRIRRTYERDSQVVFPPVEVERFLDRPRHVTPDAPYLFFGRVVPYKRADAAVAACALLDRPLVVAGSGRDLERVRAMAGPQTTFAGSITDAEVAELLATSRALLFPGLEDFGIVPVEAQAAGLPVVALGVGGALDTVVDGETGVLYDEPTPEGLAAAIERFEALTLEDGRLREHAATFSRERFLREFGELLLDAGRR